MGVGSIVKSLLRGNKQTRLDIENQKKEIFKKTAQDFVNVRDVRDKFLYTNDGYVFTYLQVNPIDINLLSLNEKIVATRALTSEMSSEKKPFKYLAVSRPVDISLLLNDYQTIINETTDHIQKELLRQEVYALSNFASSGDVVERQFYFMFWERYEEGIERDLFRRAMDFKSKLVNTNIKIESNILDESKIVRLCNLVNNPAYVNIEENSFEPTVPFLKSS